MNTTDITIRAYRFEDLTDEAAENVFRTWRDSGALADMYYREVEDIDAALYSFLDLIGYSTYPSSYGRVSGWYRFGNLEYIGFDKVTDYEEAAGCCSEVDEYAGTGDCFGFDLARAWNPRVAWLRYLKGKAEGAEDSERGEAEAAYCAWMDEMLSEVAKAYRQMVDDAFDYYYCAEGAREVWDEHEWENETAECWYDKHGRDITAIIQRYA